ncbi:hypothetical protein [Quatrionicoccus australiensis]|uniref:hypothetical protein n=1 Tax=Quatrionicoccus australiensis TaxID=138118 RepID=UPI001CF85F02|nr:hypothetical protein [Quatrionicoccus australiensis]UCV15099.1 hypothetical protein KI612_19650 [Quatrionicoccus australiensis]
MSSERIIHLADLAFIQNSLSSLSSDIGVVSGQVDSVGREIAGTRSELARLEQAFIEFVAADIKAKELALAETRQVKIRQALKTQFGYYAEVRRQATGILQAADISVVRQETINAATENLMLSAPRYWLAPALVALAAWLGDNKPLAEKALAEAIRRDDEKTSLFFALITRRSSRANGCRVWLDRYFGIQDPLKLDRQSVVLIDALASGVFGTEIRGLCAKRFETWIAELSQRVGFVEEQRKQWNDGLRSKIPTTDNATRYKHLPQYSPTWPLLNQVLNGATMQAVVLNHFKATFDGPIPVSPNLQAAVDDLLDKLVKNFDDEELPLRRDDRFCQLIIDEGGDKPQARNRFDLESKALDEHVSFTQLLTNTSMHPEVSHASKATQRFATALSKEWIKDAHQDLSASIRASVPNQIEITIEDWQGSTQNGENEKELATSLASHIERRKETELADARLRFQHWAGLAFGIGFLAMGFPGQFLFLALGAGCLIWFFTARSKIEKVRKKITEDFARLTEQSLQALKATVAEAVEWRRDFSKRDAVSALVSQFLETISAEQHLLSPHDNVRQVISTASSC